MSTQRSARQEAGACRRNQRMEFREITAADVPALFYVRPRTRENALTLEELQRLGINPQSVTESLGQCNKGWLCNDTGRVVAFSMADRATAAEWLGWLNIPTADVVTASSHRRASSCAYRPDRSVRFSMCLRPRSQASRQRANFVRFRRPLHTRLAALRGA
jgi:hypothetical protein